MRYSNILDQTTFPKVINDYFINPTYSPNLPSCLFQVYKLTTIGKIKSHPDSLPKLIFKVYIVISSNSNMYVTSYIFTN